MVKPAEFEHSFVAINSVPYGFERSKGAEAAAHGGVLARGQIVWLPAQTVFPRQARSTAAFVDGIGVVLLDPRGLVRWQPQSTEDDRTIKIRGVA